MSSQNLENQTRWQQSRFYLESYVQRLKAGEMGSLPAIAALLTLVMLFSLTSKYFLTPINFANLFVQSAELMMLCV